MNQSETIDQLAMALSKAQANIRPAVKDTKNTFFKTSYADLNSIWNACREPLATNGLAVIQAMDTKDGQLVLITTLSHASGQWIRSTVPILTVKPDAQSLGSSISYMRRYSLAALVGVTSSDEDDDGNAATHSRPESAKVETIPSNLVSAIQVKELKSLLDSCSSEKVSNFWNYLKTQLKIGRLEDVPYDKFDALKRSLLKNREEAVV